MKGKKALKQINHIIKAFNSVYVIYSVTCTMRHILSCISFLFSYYVCLIDFALPFLVWASYLGASMTPVSPFKPISYSF